MALDLRIQTNVLKNGKSAHLRLDQRREALKIVKITGLERVLVKTDVTCILPSGNRSTVKVTLSEVASFSITRFSGKGLSCTLILLAVGSMGRRGNPYDNAK